MENADKLVTKLCRLPNESGWVEFKQNNWSPEMIGQDISALANSAVLSEHDHAYMIWGVDDDTHTITGTDIRLNSLRKGNQELENWLRYLLSQNADFSFLSAEVDGRHVELIVIAKARGVPVKFEKVEYIRSGSYTKKLMEFPSLQAQLWDKLLLGRFEDSCVKTGLQWYEVLHLLNLDAYLNLLHIPFTDNETNLIRYVTEEGIVKQQDDGLYSITALGAILFAKKLSSFSSIGRKSIRVVQYETNNKLSISKEEAIDEGYATAFEKAVNYINALLPAKEDINSTQRRTITAIPLLAIRESIANALVHQDFYITGAGPVVEMFTNRIEVTNPGVPLVDVMRIIDNPPRSRNEKLAALMRRMGMCEELGRGWDRMVISCELQQLPAPQIHAYKESTKVTLFSYLEFTSIPITDKLWSTYLHACVKYLEGHALTNSSLRERFGLAETAAGSISRLIKEALDKELIKHVNPDTAPRYMKYIPIWG